MKMKKNVITYQQMWHLLEHLIKTDQRKPDEPFMVNGDYLDTIECGRTGMTMVTGELEIEVTVPPLKL